MFRDSWPKSHPLEPRTPVYHITWVPPPPGHEVPFYVQGARGGGVVAGANVGWPKNYACSVGIWSAYHSALADRADLVICINYHLALFSLFFSRMCEVCRRWRQSNSKLSTTILWKHGSAEKMITVNFGSPRFVFSYSLRSWGVRKPSWNKDFRSFLDCHWYQG